MEVLRISTVVDKVNPHATLVPLEVLRISTVVDTSQEVNTLCEPLEVLRISTVVDLCFALPRLALWKY